MEVWVISWKEGRKKKSTNVLNEGEVVKVKRNIKKFFDAKDIKVKHITETYSQVRLRERAMGIRQ